MTEQRYLNFLTVEDYALLMIDHQTGTMLSLQDICWSSSAPTFWHWFPLG